MIKFMRRSYVFVIAWFLLGLSPAKSQYVSTTNSATSPLGKVSISSPTAAALGKYGDIPVGYHTGIPNVNIPVYTIKTGSLELPINLSYHAGGLKVQEQASWVGAGWALDAGGVITRTVMGAPDDRGLNANTDRGYFSDYGYANYLFSDGPVTCGPGTGVGCPTGSVYAPQDGLIQNGHLDGEPDLYFFNFNGHTGKFYFNDDRTPMLVPEQDLKITPIYPGSDVRGITGFIITTPDGVQYYFGKSQDAGNIDAVEVTYNVSTQALSNTNLGSTSSWFLNKIVSADNQFTINLIYQSEKSSYYTLSMFPVSGLPDPTLGGASNLEYDLNKNFVDGVRLNKITFPKWRSGF